MQNIIPNNVQTMSKMRSRYGKGYPKNIEYASGSYVFDENDKEYIDYTCALGPIILGYGYPEVDMAVKSQMHRGILYGLPSSKEQELAQKLVDIIPCAEMVRFLKTGSEACSAAIKIAKAYTEREVILSYGYHGWHPWTKKVKEFKYNQLNELKTDLRWYKVAAIIMEPYVYEEPKDNFLQEVIKAAHEQGTLVIFDEVITGFRTPGMSAQKYFGITPDLACFSKAMANGYPMAAVVGKRKYMKVLEKDCFVSSTFGGDLIGITAALATINYMEKYNVLDHIQEMGRILMSGFPMSGYPWRPRFDIKNKKAFWSRCIKKGIFFGEAQFINYSHKIREIEETRKVIEQCL